MLRFPRASACAVIGLPLHRPRKSTSEVGGQRADLLLQLLKNSKLSFMSAAVRAAPAFIRPQRGRVFAGWGLGRGTAPNPNENGPAPVPGSGHPAGGWSPPAISGT